MATITLNYDGHNAAARHKLNNLMNSGLFVEQETMEEHKRDMEIFLLNSKRNIAPLIAKYI